MNTHLAALCSWCLLQDWAHQPVSDELRSVLVTGSGVIALPPKVVRSQAISAPSRPGQDLSNACAKSAVPLGLRIRPAWVGHQCPA